MVAARRLRAIMLPWHEQLRAVRCMHSHRKMETSSIAAATLTCLFFFTRLHRHTSGGRSLARYCYCYCYDDDDDYYYYY